MVYYVVNSLEVIGKGRDSCTAKNPDKGGEAPLIYWTSI